LEATVFSFKKGWFHSGDLGYFKNMQVDLKNGQKIKGKFFFIVGRLKEIIIKGGVNISPSAIEDVLLKTFNGISEVSVIGIPDSRMGEEVAAVVVTKEGISPDKIRKEFNSKEGVLPGLSSYEFPKRIFFMDSLPKTSTGKIQRVEVKK
jgi:acyl-CoA synthetase (AMP-forming)/AMP-acid ligase II